MFDQLGGFFGFMFFNPDSLMSIGWVAIYIIGAWFLFRRSGAVDGGFAHFLFPSEIYRSVSFRDDLKIIAAYLPINFLAFATRVSLQVGLMTLVGGWVFETGNKLGWPGTIPPVGPSEEPSAVMTALIVVVIALSLDFGNFISHVLLHRVDWLWQFHKVHHSALALAPTTQFRSHPVEPILKETSMGTCTGLSLGVLTVLGVADPHNLPFASVWIVYFIYHLSFHFRHSHLWISFGPRLSYIFNSPAMHQIHHSIEERHLNTNYAAIFSLWDWMFGTIYIPKEREEFRIGLGDPEEERRFQGLRGLWLEPFRQLGSRVMARPWHGFVRHFSTHKAPDRSV